MRSDENNKVVPIAAKRSATRLAKFDVPKLETAVRRTRLFALLDEQLRLHLLVWIHAPPGAGKTTLAGTYLVQISRTVLWYRVDPGDADLATFFAHLREAALGVTDRAESLPALSPEYLLDVPTFARNFFRSLFGLFNTATALVLDNYQEGGEGTLDALLLAAVGELPNHINIVVLSRSAPAAAFAPLMLRHTLSTIDWQSLRLTLAEAADIASNLQVTDRAAVLALHSHCDGWTAGLVLLLEYSKRLGTPQRQISAAARETVFNYFSSELFATVPGSIQRLLLSTALLPTFTPAQAAAFATREEAEVALEWLQKRNFFIEYQEGVQRRYHYHALFRDFLLERGKVYFSEVERRDLLVKSAQVFAADGQSEIAMALALEAHAWPDAAALICALAPEMLRSGRISAIERSIGALPPGTLDDTPWVRYWLGFARMPFDPGQSRRQLELAYDSFACAADQMGRLMACAAILNTFFIEWADQRGADRWVAILSDLLDREDAAWPMQVEAAIVFALQGLLLRNLEHPLTARLAERACAAFRRTENMEQRVMMGSVAFWYFGMAGPVLRGEQILQEVNATINLEELSPLLRIQWSALKIFHAHVSFRINDYAERLATVEEVLDMTRSSGIRVMDATIAGQCMYLTLKANDLPRAEHYLRAIGAALSPQRPLDAAQFQWHRSAVAFLRGDLNLAHECIRECHRISESLGCTFGNAQDGLLLVSILMELGRHGEARREADKLVRDSRALNSQILLYSALLVRSYVLLNANEEIEGFRVLREALAFGAATGQTTPSPWIHHKILQQLCEAALRNEIEPQQARDTIVSLGLKPTRFDVETWPWPIRIYTLGRFSVLLEDTPIRFSSKAQKRPLEMLRVLIALGGRSVGIDAVTTTMWPEEEAARAGFDVTLMRLRKLLRHADALILTDGKLTLNEQVCWVDSWAFERAVARLDGDSDTDATIGVATLYRGAFMAHETDIPCIVNARDRLAEKFQRLVLKTGKRHESSRAWEAAAGIYRRGLEQDNISEEFYRRLMSCQLQLGQRAEAIKTYKRCRDLLSINLGAKPSAQTEALYRRLMQL